MHWKPSFLESVLVAVEPEERSLLDALERLLELDDVAWAGEAGRHLGVDVGQQPA